MVSLLREKKGGLPEQVISLLFEARSHTRAFPGNGDKPPSFKSLRVKGPV